MSTSARRFVQSLTGRRQSDVPGSSTKLVYGHHELDEIAVVSSNATPQQLKYGSGSLSNTANGPRIVPGTASKSGGNEGLSASGSRLDTGSPAVSGYTTGNKSSSESLRPNRILKSVSRQNLLDIVRLGYGKQKPHQRYLATSRDSLAAAYINRTSAASELDLSRSKVRRKEIRNRLKLPGSFAEGKTLNGSAGPAGGGGPQGAGPQPGPNHQHSYHGSKSSQAKWSFVFDPAGRLCYYWSMIVSLAFLYNFWVIIYRFAFQEINRDSILVWFVLDYSADFLYIIDILFHFRTGYLEDGVLQTDSTKLRTHYMNSTTFYIDCLCLLPLDFLYLSIGFNSVLRSFRLVKIYRFWAFMDRTERHTNYPNLFRSASLIHYLLVIFHWNGCLYHIICKNNGFGSRNWVYSDNDTTDVVKQYLQSYYWCTLALTTIGDLPRPRSKGEYIFVIVQLLFGLLLFATVLGHVANIVTSVSAARKEFQAKLDGVKTYMRMRRVPNHLQVKVIKWFDYLWLTQKCSDEEKAVSCLPDKLKAEIAINVHLDTLKRVEIFQNTEAGFLCELVLRLRPVLFSPGDYICRKGEVGKEMYIVNRGRLQVVADNGKTVLATLKAGSYFGEISILNMGTAGNRRTASVRSVGYSDLFVLSKKDMWDVLKEYPAARVRLEAIAVKRLEKYKRAPLEKDLFITTAAMGRSQSTPGLLETRGRVPLEDMWVSPVSVEPLLKGVMTSHYANSGFSPAPSPTCRSNTGATAATTESPLSILSSVHSSDHQDQPPTKPLLPPKSSYVGEYVVKSKEEPLHKEEFIAEIKRLRERLVTLESENATLNEKLNQQQWEVEHRLAEIEMQICGASSADSSGEENNRESII